MNEKDYIDVLSRHGVPVPPSWGGMTGSGADAMFSLGGRWLKAGQKTPQGHTIDSYDPSTGFLGMSYEGVPLVPLKMRESVIQDYKPMFTGGHPYDQDPSMNIPTFTEEELAMAQEMYGIHPEQAPTPIKTDFDLKPYKGFTPKQVDMIRNNMTGEKALKYKNNGIMSYDDYEALVSDGKAKEGIYVVPYLTPEGEVDLQDFFFEGYKKEK